MPINEMKKFSDLRNEGDSTVTLRRELLENHKNSALKQIDGLIENLNKIEEKIEIYKDMEEKLEE